jgi:hypothetical protein
LSSSFSDSHSSTLRSSLSLLVRNRRVTHSARIRVKVLYQPLLPVTVRAVSECSTSCRRRPVSRPNGSLSSSDRRRTSPVTRPAVLSARLRVSRRSWRVRKRRVTHSARIRVKLLRHPLLPVLVRAVSECSTSHCRRSVARPHRSLSSTSCRRRPVTRPAAFSGRLRVSR